MCITWTMAPRSHTHRLLEGQGGGMRPLKRQALSMLFGWRYCPIRPTHGHSLQYDQLGTPQHRAGAMEAASATRAPAKSSRQCNPGIAAGAARLPYSAGLLALLKKEKTTACTRPHAANGPEPPEAAKRPRNRSYPGLMHNYASSVNNRASVMDLPTPLVK